jgi:hypothetical protein
MRRPRHRPPEAGVRLLPSLLTAFLGIWDYQRNPGMLVGGVLSSHGGLRRRNGDELRGCRRRHGMRWHADLEGTPAPESDQGVNKSFEMPSAPSTAQSADACQYGWRGKPQVVLVHV